MGIGVWCDIFPTIVAIFVPEGSYDHSPILLKHHETGGGMFPYRYCKMWSENPYFQRIVCSC